MCIFSLDFFFIFLFLSLVLSLTAYEHGIHGSLFFLSNLFLYQSQKSPYTWLYFFNLIISSIIIITIFFIVGFISAGAGVFLFLFSTICSIGYWYKKAIGISGVWLFSLISLHCLIHFHLLPFLHSVFSSFFFRTLNTFFFPQIFFAPRKACTNEKYKGQQQQNQQRRPGFGSSFFSLLLCRRDRWI